MQRRTLFAWVTRLFGGAAALAACPTVVSDSVTGKPLPRLGGSPESYEEARTFFRATNRLCEVLEDGSLLLPAPDGGWLRYPPGTPGWMLQYPPRYEEVRQAEGRAGRRGR